jgi:hypothetical protein
MRRSSGFYAVGVEDRVFRDALRAAGEAMGANAVIPAGGERATIDGDAVTLFADAKRAIAGLLCKVSGARARIAKLRALVATCLGSEMLQTDGAAARRAALRSLVTLAVGIGLFTAGWWVIGLR